MRWFQNHEVYAQIYNMKHKTILPDEGFGKRVIRLTDDLERLFIVSCKPKDKGSKHRLMVHCDCAREIPFGRMHQHYLKCKIRKGA